MNINMDVGDAHEGRGRGGGRGGRGRGQGHGRGRGPFRTGRWQSTDGQEQSTNGGRGARGGRGKQRGGWRGGSVDSRQYALPSALSSTGAATSVVSTGAAAAFSTGASAASAAVSTSTCTNATIVVTGAPAAAAIATGAIANTAAVSTGASTASAAANFMGAPAVLPPPQGRQTYHPLDTEQDISTAASAVTCAAGATSTGTAASAAVEYDSLSRRAQMIILMDRNASNASSESLSASYVKSMYDSIMRQRNAIIAEVVKEKPELEILITDALDAPFIVENRQRPGKIHCVEKLVDIWEYYEQVPTLRAGFIGRSRATSLRSYTDTMCRYHSLAETAVTENRSRLRGWKSEPMSDVERARLFLMDGGVELGLQYPTCPRCQHVSTTSLTGHPTMVLLMS